MFCRQCEYLDLYLIHWPVPGKHVEAYKTLLKLQKEGLVKDVGVSNYTIEDFEDLKKAGITVTPSVNQIEINPFLNRSKTIAYMKKNGITPMAYRGLGQATVLEHPAIVEIAKEIGHVTPAQVLGRWLVQQDICHIPKSVQLERMQNNADIFSFTLTPSQMNSLNSLTTNQSLEAFRERHLRRIVGNTPLANECTLNTHFTVE